MDYKKITQHPDFIKYQGYIYVLAALLFIKLVALPVIDVQNVWLEVVSVNALQIKSPESVKEGKEKLAGLISQIQNNTQTIAQSLLPLGNSELEQIKLIKQLTELASKYELKMVSHKWENVNLNQKLQKNTLTTHISGSGTLMQSFLNDISNSQNVWQLESMQLTEKKVSNSVNKISNLNISISTLQLREAL